MKFCSHCGSDAIAHTIPTGDNRLRHVCGTCGHIFYENPRVVCGALPVWEDKILLCRRAIEPRLGFWTLPAGYMENGETTEQAALRETHEEAQARLNIDGLYTIYNLPHISQVYFFYRGQLVDGQHSAGFESLDTELFTPAQIPWDELAFPTIEKTLKYYLNDIKTQAFPIRVIDLDYRQEAAPLSDA